MRASLSSPLWKYRGWKTRLYLDSLSNYDGRMVIASLAGWAPSQGLGYEKTWWRSTIGLLEVWGSVVLTWGPWISCSSRALETGLVQPEAHCSVSSHRQWGVRERRHGKAIFVRWLRFMTCWNDNAFGNQWWEAETGDSHTHTCTWCAPKSITYLFVYFVYLFSSLKLNMYLAVWLLWIRPVESLGGTILEKIRIKTWQKGSGILG